MSEPVQFWLDNKMSDGIRVASIGSQLLVVYRERYYVVEKGAAQMKGGKPLRYSLSSMPLVWKKALRGDALPQPTVSRKERAKKETLPPPVQPLPAPTPAQPSVATRPAVAGKLPGNAKPTEIKPAAQTVVAVCCPECRFKHELPLEKGKNGKPFFVACAKCKAEFAVRFVPVMVYQAQVAGFR